MIKTIKKPVFPDLNKEQIELFNDDIAKYMIYLCDVMKNNRINICRSQFEEIKLKEKIKDLRKSLENLYNEEMTEKEKSKNEKITQIAPYLVENRDRNRELIEEMIGKGEE